MKNHQHLKKRSKRQEEPGISISQLAEKHGKDRATVRRLLRNVPFTFGPKGAHLYDQEAADAAIESEGRNVSDILRERLLKVRAERELRELQLKEKQKHMVPAEDMLFCVKDLIAGLRAIIQDWPEQYLRKAEFGIWRVGIQVSQACGINTEQEEKELEAAERQFEKDLKNGAVPVYHWETAIPENKCRVWSQELNRYYTKAEIIAKFGPSAQISPIDDILSEAEQLENSDESASKVSVPS